MKIHLNEVARLSGIKTSKSNIEILSYISAPYDFDSGADMIESFHDHAMSAQTPGAKCFWISDSEKHGIEDIAEYGVSIVYTGNGSDKDIIEAFKRAME